MRSWGRAVLLGAFLALPGFLANGGPADAGEALDRIKSEKLLRIGVRTDAPPFAVLKDGRVTGFTVDLCQVVGSNMAQRLGIPDLRLDVIPVDATNRFDKLAAGEIDILCGATTATLSRRERVSFSIPTFITGVGAILRKEAPKPLQDLLIVKTRTVPTDAEVVAAFKDRKIGVRAGSTAERWLETGGVGRIEGVSIEQLPSHRQGYEKVVAGELDAYIADLAILRALTHANGAVDENVLISQKTYTNEPYALAMRRGDEDLRLLVDSALSHLYRQGEVLRLFRNYFGKPTAEVVFFYQAVALPD